MLFFVVPMRAFARDGFALMLCFRAHAFMLSLLPFMVLLVPMRAFDIRYIGRGRFVHQDCRVLEVSFFGISGGA